MYITLSPAYARDYKTAKDARKDFEDGKDFIIENMDHPSCGRYCSIRDLKTANVQIRYKQKRDVLVLRLVDGKIMETK